MSKEKVTVYEANGKKDEMSIKEAIRCIEAGTHKAEGKRAFEVPPEWIAPSKSKTKLVAVNSSNKIEKAEAED